MKEAIYERNLYQGDLKSKVIVVTKESNGFAVWVDHWNAEENEMELVALHYSGFNQREGAIEAAVAITNRFREEGWK